MRIEPWFLTFNAKVEFHPAMTPEDLAKANLESLGKQWGAWTITWRHPDDRTFARPGNADARVNAVVTWVEERIRYWEFPSS